MKTQNEIEIEDTKKMLSLFELHVVRNKPEILELDKKTISLMFGSFCIGFSLKDKDL